MGKHVKRSFNISKFCCPDCECSMFVPRNLGQQRENGHVKDLWCPWCEETKKMVEQKGYM